MGTSGRHARSNTLIIEHDVDLARYTTFGVHVRAKVLVTTQSVEDVQRAVALHPEARVLGGGSNVLLVHPQDALIRVAIPTISIVEESDTSVCVCVGAGEAWADFVRWAVEHNYGGLENLALIPGTVGAAPIQNIGAYGLEQDTAFVELEAVDRLDGAVRRFSKEQCAFGYRTSIFKTDLANRYVITSVTYRLSKPPHTIHTSYKDVAAHLEHIGQPTLHDVYKAVVDIRTAKLPDPSVTGNAGSFFKNPVIPFNHYQQLLQSYPEMPGYPVDEHHIKVPAAWLIDRAGWKGYREGAVGVHERQALVIVHYGGDNGASVLSLSQRIRDSVLEKYQIPLEAEVNIW